MTDRDSGRRPAGSGVDGSYVENRKPTVDDQDDIDDEDGILMDELDDDTDLTLRVEDPDQEPQPDADLDRIDKGAVNLERKDLEP
jgi:hypothetical protein